MRRLLFVAIVGCLLAPTSAWAGTGNFFIGIGGGQASLEAPAGDSRFDLDNTGWKGYIGYRFGRYVGVEGQYTDLGTFEDSGLGIEAKANMFTLYAMGILPISRRFDLYGKLGAARWETDITSGEPPENVKEDGVNVAWGVGLKFGLTQSVALTLEWEETDLGSAQDARFISLAFQYDF